MTDAVSPTQDPQYAEFLRWKQSQQGSNTAASMPAVVPAQDEAQPSFGDVLRGLVHAARFSHEGIVRAYHAAIDDFERDYDEFKSFLARRAGQVGTDVLSALTPSDESSAPNNSLPVENVGGNAPGASNG